MITLTIFTFMGAYHSFFWPLVMLKSSHKYTLPIGLLYFDSSRGQETHLLMAAVTLSSHLTIAHTKSSIAAVAPT